MPPRRKDKEAQDSISLASRPSSRDEHYEVPSLGRRRGAGQLDRYPSRNPFDMSAAPDKVPSRVLNQLLTSAAYPSSSPFADPKASSFAAHDALNEYKNKIREWEQAPEKRHRIGKARDALNDTYRELFKSSLTVEGLPDSMASQAVRHALGKIGVKFEIGDIPEKLVKAMMEDDMQLYICRDAPSTKPYPKYFAEYE